MAAYMIGSTQISDPTTYEEYRRQVGPLVAKYGGKFVVRGGAITVLEGTWQPTRLVVVEFPNMEALRGWYDSPEYAPLIAMRQKAAKGDLIAVEGS